MFKAKIKLFFLIIFICYINKQKIFCIDNKENNKKLILITSLYNESNPARIEEYRYCLNLNLDNSSIKKIHIMYDTVKDNNDNQILNYLKSKKFIDITYIKGRPTFGFIFDLANRLYQNEKIIIANADIYFDKSLDKLLNYDLNNKFLILSRWDIEKDKSIKACFQKLEWGYGSDAWIFRSPIKRFRDDNFELGMWACDTRLTYQASKSNLKVLNPSYSIMCYHYHLSDLRNYLFITPKGKGMAWIKAGKLEDEKSPIYMLQEEARCINEKTKVETNKSPKKIDSARPIIYRNYKRK